MLGRYTGNWWALGLRATAAILLGIIAFTLPGPTRWALVTGALEIAAAMRLRRIMTGEWLLLVGGVLSIVLAVFVALIPPLGVVFLIWWLGAYALAYGVVELVLAFRVRRWSQVNA